MGMLGMHKGVSTGPGLTKQAFADEVDINKIVAGFEKTGMVTHLNEMEPFFGDVSHLVAYQECLDIVKTAESLFNGMDARIRERFKHDPMEMIDFLQDSRNLDEAVKLGMAVKRPGTGFPAPIPPVPTPTPTPTPNPQVVGDHEHDAGDVTRG